MEFISRDKKFELQVGDQKMYKKLANRVVDFVVIHHTQANSTDEAIKMYKNYGVSAHYVIDEIGGIFLLVEEEDVAFHAGVSYWAGVDGLNNCSIGIEFISSDPFENGFSQKQMDIGLELLKNLVKKYSIKQQNIVGHSDIAYDRQEKLLNRKQDPSHLFDWSFLARSNVGIFPQISCQSDKILYQKGQKHQEIAKIKQDLHKFGYLVNNFDENFDEEMKFLTRVFNSRFNKQITIEVFDNWHLSSQLILRGLLGSSVMRS